MHQNLSFIFLDVDGVLNTDSEIQKHGLDFIDTEKVKLVKNIVDKTNAKIVLSSDWRIDPRNFHLVEKALKKHNLEIFSKTKELIFGNRDAEIKLWLDENTGLKWNDENLNFAIIDDCSLAGINGLMHTFFKTSCRIGLTEEISQRVIKHLQK